MKVAITILNIVSAIAILVYPGILIAAVIGFASPGATKSLTGWVVFTLSVSYPLIIGILIFLSRRTDSILIATLGLIPLLFLIYTFIFQEGIKKKKYYEAAHRDYIYSPNSFLTINKKDAPITEVVWWERRFFITYESYEVATIFGSKWINPQKIGFKRMRDNRDNLLKMSKNAEGKTLLDMYILVPDSEVKNILKKL